MSVGHERLGPVAQERVMPRAAQLHLIASSTRPTTTGSGARWCHRRGGPANEDLLARRGVLVATDPRPWAGASRLAGVAGGRPVILARPPPDPAPRRGHRRRQVHRAASAR